MYRHNIPIGQVLVFFSHTEFESPAAILSKGRDCVNNKELLGTGNYRANLAPYTAKLRVGEHFEMIQVTSDIVINTNEIQLDFVRASGPGGQNVNKVSTAVQLRFDVTRSSLPADVRDRLIRLAGSRMTLDGILIIKAARFRTQERNRQDAVERLAQLVRRAVLKPAPRVKTRPSRAAKERHKAAKRRRSQVKKLRRSPIVGGSD